MYTIRTVAFPVVDGCTVIRKDRIGGGIDHVSTLAIRIKKNGNFHYDSPLNRNCKAYEFGTKVILVWDKMQSNESVLIDYFPNIDERNDAHKYLKTYFFPKDFSFPKLNSTKYVRKIMLLFTETPYSRPVKIIPGNLGELRIKVIKSGLYDISKLKPGHFANEINPAINDAITLRKIAISKSNRKTFYSAPDAYVSYIEFSVPDFFRIRETT